MSANILCLLEWSSRTDKPLPMPAAQIAALEQQGHLVDLDTGHIIHNGAAIQVEETIIGEATAIVLQHESEVSG